VRLAPEHFHIRDPVRRLRWRAGGGVMKEAEPVVVEGVALLSSLSILEGDAGEMADAPRLPFSLL
jgi:hypothetical protein